MVERLKNLRLILTLLTNAITVLLGLKTANSRREKWRENHDHVVIFAVHVCLNANLNLSNTTKPVLHLLLVSTRKYAINNTDFGFTAVKTLSF